MFDHIEWIPESQQSQLQNLLEDIFLNNEKVPQWIMDLHMALIYNCDVLEAEKDNAG